MVDVYSGPKVNDSRLSKLKTIFKSLPEDSVLVFFSGDEVDKLSDAPYEDVPIDPNFQYMFCKNIRFLPRVIVVVYKENGVYTVGHISDFIGEEYWVQDDWKKITKDDLYKLLNKNNVFLGGDAQKFLTFIKKFIPNIKTVVNTTELNALIEKQRERKTEHDIQTLFRLKNLLMEIIFNDDSELNKWLNKQKTVHVKDIHNFLKMKMLENNLEESFPLICVPVTSMHMLGTESSKFHPPLMYDIEIKKGTYIMLDAGFTFSNHCAKFKTDFTNVVPFGKPPEYQQKLINKVKEICKECCKYCVPGMSLSDIDFFSRILIYNFLLEEGIFKKPSENVDKVKYLLKAVNSVYGHSVGHYVGLLVHDVGDYERKFQKNDILAIEPAIYLFRDVLKDKPWIDQKKLNESLGNKEIPGCGCRIEYTLYV